jgi:hypothetical protein
MTHLDNHEQYWECRTAFDNRALGQFDTEQEAIAALHAALNARFGSGKMETPNGEQYKHEHSPRHARLVDGQVYRSKPVPYEEPLLDFCR